MMFRIKTAKDTSYKCEIVIIIVWRRTLQYGDRQRDRHNHNVYVYDFCAYNDNYYYRMRIKGGCERRDGNSMGLFSWCFFFVWLEDLRGICINKMRALMLVRENISRCALFIKRYLKWNLQLIGNLSQWIDGDETLIFLLITVVIKQTKINFLCKKSLFIIYIKNVCFYYYLTSYIHWII